MKKVYAVICLSMFLFSCKNKEYKYKIEGQVPVRIERQVTMTEVNITEELRPAIAYTDSIAGQTSDSIWYYNSDGSKLTIYKPYRVTMIK